jgi:heat shock protein HslJ
MKVSLPNSRFRLTLVMLLLLAGCETYNHRYSSGGAATLAGTSWLAEEIDGHAVKENVRSMLQFQSEDIYGSAGCNLYSAPIVVRDSGFRAGTVVTTRAICSDAAMGQELRFLAALSSTTGYRMEGDTLRLTDLQGVTGMRLTRMSVSPRAFLCGDGVNFGSMFLRPAGADTVEVAFGAVSRVLTRAPALSGERFSGGDISLSSEGDEATLEVGDHRYTCTEKAGG